MTTLSATTTCPKCSAPRIAGALDCPRCGVVFARAEAALARREEREAETPFEPAPVAADAELFTTPDGVRALVLWRRFGAVVSVVVGLGMAKILSGTPFAGMLVFIYLVAAGLGLLVAHGLSRHRAWGRIAEIVLSAIGLLAFPLGTAMSAFTLYYLTRPGAALLFGGAMTVDLGPDQIDALRDFRGSIAGMWIRRLVNLGIVVTIIGIVVVGLLMATVADRSSGTSVSHVEVSKIHEMIGDYGATLGRYPDTQPIEGLALTMGGGKPAFPTKDPWGHDYRYEKLETAGIRVGSAGPDGKWAKRALADYPCDASKPCDYIVWDGAGYVGSAEGR